MEKEPIDQITQELEELLTMKELQPLEDSEEVINENATDEMFVEIPISRKKVKNNKAMLTAFVVPMILMVLVFIQRGIFPFGDESFLRTDMYHQYAPFFSEFQHKIKSGGSLFYSWNVGLGINFLALFAYYLASPLNWILWIIPSAFVIEFMTYLIVFKIGLSGLTMAYYLRKHCKTDDFGVAFFGIFYALSGYMAAYSWNIMWLDCILLFPLIMLGLERLVKEGKGLLYCITLGVAIMSNYYISFMICIFLILYFLVLLVLEEELSWELFVAKSGGFAIFSLIAGGLAAVVLLPEVYALQMTASGDVNFPQTYSEYFSIFDMVARHIGNVEIELGLDHWPNIYCGVAVLMFFSLYIANNKINKKEKAVYCLLLLFFFSSFSINLFNFIWHGFHYPNSLPCRQSFIYIFLMLVMCYKAYMHLEHIPWKHIVMSFWGAVIFILLAQKLVEAEHFHFAAYYGAIITLSLYLGVLALYKKGGIYETKALWLGLALVSLEAGLNTGITSVTTTSRDAYIKDNEAVETLVDSIKSDTFYRIEKVTRKTKNDGAWMHFPSVSLFSSTANADITDLLKTLGCEASTNSYSITGSTPLVDSLLSVKYGLYSEEPEESELRTLVEKEDTTWLYENNYTLPLGFMVSSDFEYRWDMNDTNPATVQNNLAHAVGADPVLELLAGIDANGDTMSFAPEESGYYYVFISNKKVDDVVVTKEDDKKTYTNVNRGYLVDVGYCEVGEKISMEAKDSNESLNAEVYRFSESGLQQVYQALSEESWKLTSWQDDYLEGTIQCEETGTLYTSIPFDKGWKITVNGEEQVAQKIIGTFIGIRLTPGTHRIVMSYEPEGYALGKWISLGSLLLLFIVGGISMYLLSRYRKEEVEEEKQEEQEYE